MDNNKQGMIGFKLEGSDEETQFYVLEQITLNGRSYLLVADSDEDEAEALILKELRLDQEDVIYEVIEDETELDYVSDFFEAIYEDLSIER